MSQKRKEMEQRTKKEILDDRNESKKLREACEKGMADTSKPMEAVSDLLPSFKTNDPGPITDEQLKMLFVAFFGEPEKLYDSDDSIISETDHMTDEEIKEKDRRFRETLADIPVTIAQSQKVLNWLKDDNWTKAAREARRRSRREEGLTTDEEKIEAEKKYQEELQMLEDRLAVEVQVFSRRTSEDHLPYITCSQFARVLDILADILAEGDESDRDHVRKILSLDINVLADKIKYMGCNFNVFLDGSESLEAMVCRKVRLLLRDPCIMDVVDSERYGFHLTTSQIVRALMRYYVRKGRENDNGTANDKLAIHIRSLVTTAYTETSKANRDFKINETLTLAIFNDDD